MLGLSWVLDNGVWRSGTIGLALGPLRLLVKDRIYKRVLACGVPITSEKLVLALEILHTLPPPVQH